MPRENEEESTIENLSPLGGLIIGIVLVYASLTTEGAVLFIRVILGSVGLVVLVSLVYYLHSKYKERGIKDAIRWLFSQPLKNEETKQDTGDKETEKTPPCPDKLKNKLYFERAEQECEWCGKNIDNPEIHHIKPRKENGPNEPRNLLVLCPNCHTKMDSIGRSKQKYKARKQNEGWSESE